MSMSAIEEVSRLLDMHGEGFVDCPGCDICKRIEELRKEIDRSPEVKFKHILDKGQDMTKSEIKFLLENEVPKRVIREAVKMGGKTFYDLLKTWGIEGGNDELAKLKMTVDEYIELSQKMTIKEIADLKGVTPATIYNWRIRNRDEINRRTEVKKSQNPEKTQKQQTVKIGKYEKIGTEIGRLVDQKNKAYGDAFNKSGEFLKILYPEGIRPEQYNDMLAIVRIFDKLMRIATDKNALNENPYNDIAGYGILKAELPKEGAKQ